LTRTRGNGGFHAVAEGFFGSLIAGRYVITEIEDLRSELNAKGVRFTQTGIDQDPHFHGHRRLPNPSSVSRLPFCMAPPSRLTRLSLLH
jgi:hypothetical protein